MKDRKADIEYIKGLMASNSEDLAAWHFFRTWAWKVVNMLSELDEKDAKIAELEAEVKRLNIMEHEPVDDGKPPMFIPTPNWVANYVRYRSKGLDPIGVLDLELVPHMRRVTHIGFLDSLRPYNIAGAKVFDLLCEKSRTTVSAYKPSGKVSIDDFVA